MNWQASIGKTLTLLTAFLFTATILAAQKNPLYVYDFELKQFTIPERVAFLQKQGYAGVTFPVNTPNDFATLNKYLATQKQGNGYSIPAIFTSFSFVENNKNKDVWRTITDKIKDKNIKLWVIYNGGTPARQQIIDTLKVMADYTANAGVEMVIYPHDQTLMMTLEESVGFLKEAKLTNVFTSLHLCHELRAGNAKKLLALGRKYAPYIKLATISGADYLVPYAHTADWKDAIKPLYMGDYDTQEFVQVLAQIGYSGPTVLHTFGIKEPAPEERLSKSLTKWNEMNASVASIMKTDITKTLDAPESAYFDEGSQAWYVSSLGGGSVTLEEDNYGWISKLDKNGKIIKSRWVEGLNAPTGMAS